MKWKEKRGKSWENLYCALWKVAEMSRTLKFLEKWQCFRRQLKLQSETNSKEGSARSRRQLKLQRVKWKKNQQSEKQAGLTGSVGLQRIAFRGKAKTSIENSLEESEKVVTSKKTVSRSSPWAILSKNNEKLELTSAQLRWLEKRRRKWQKWKIDQIPTRFRKLRKKAAETFTTHFLKEGKRRKWLQETNLAARRRKEERKQKQLWSEKVKSGESCTAHFLVSEEKEAKAKRRNIRKRRKKKKVAEVEMKNVDN